jgi:hypothetical protein
LSEPFIWDSHSLFHNFSTTDNAPLPFPGTGIADPPGIVSVVPIDCAAAPFGMNIADNYGLMEEDRMG